jgi:hypothetical protein
MQKIERPEINSYPSRTNLPKQEAEGKAVVSGQWSDEKTNN